VTLLYPCTCMRVSHTYSLPSTRASRRHLSLSAERVSFTPHPHPRDASASLRVPREMISTDEAMKRGPFSAEARRMSDKLKHPAKGTRKVLLGWIERDATGESSLPFRDSEFGFQNAPPSSRA